jgi:hypothetical protein
MTKSTAMITDSKIAAIEDEYILRLHFHTNCQVTVSIECQTCGLVSHNDNDVKYRFCVYCNVFHEDAAFKNRIQRGDA